MTVFDWFNARATCSVDVIFEKLKLDLSSDVDKAQAKRPVHNGVLAHYGFQFIVSDDGNKLKVVVHGHNVRDSVSFRLTKDSIEILDHSGAVKFSAEPTLNNKGECRLKINGEEQELWYLRKLALEDLFFRTY